MVTHIHKLFKVDSRWLFGVRGHAGSYYLDDYGIMRNEEEEVCDQRTLVGVINNIDLIQRRPPFVNDLNELVADKGPCRACKTQLKAGTPVNVSSYYRATCPSCGAPIGLE